MMPMKFVHAADLHLDSPFKGLSSLNDEIACALRDATFRTFDNIVSLCIEKKVDFLLIAGDVFDSDDRSLRAQLYFRDGLRRLSNLGIATYVVHGNHDPLDRWSATLEWPHEVHVFKGSNVMRIPVKRGNEVIAHVYGISYSTREIRENLAKKFRRAPGDPFAIGLLHCNCGADTGHEPYAPCSLADLIEADMDYWALGHVHTRAVLSKSKPTVIYPGNPVGRNPRELGPRGCYLVEVNAQGLIDPQFVPVDAVRWSWESLSVEDVETVDELINRLEALCEEIRYQPDRRNVLCRITLKGRSPIHEFLYRKGTIPDLESRLREKFASQEPFVWIDRLENKTSPLLDFEQIRQGSDFLGELAKFSAERQENESALRESLKEQMNALHASPLGRRFISAPSLSELKAWVAEAEYRCLDLLCAGED